MGKLAEISRGERLLHLRGTLKPADAARRAGIDRSTWVRLESGERGSSQQSNATLERIAQAFAVPPICLTGSVTEGISMLLSAASGDTALHRLQWVLAQVQRIYGLTEVEWAKATGLAVDDLRSILAGHTALSPALIDIILAPANAKPGALVPPADWNHLMDWCRSHNVTPDRALAILQMHVENG